MDIYHTHHIVPKHMGGSDDPENLVTLTIEEHAKAHLDLYNTHNKIEDLWAYQLLSSQLSFKDGFKKLLSKNAKDTHKKQKERGSGLYNRELQSQKGKLGAKASNLGKTNNPNYVRVCCLSCRKETTVPTFFRHHNKKCF